jgi:serine/threonine protein kinase
MREKEYFHSDVKPANTQLVKCEDRENTYILKIIDFGAASQKIDICISFNPDFFDSLTTNYDQDGNAIFNNAIDRFKNEFYTVIRTL